MPVSLSKIASNLATVTLWFGEDSLTIEYYPLRITTEMMAQMQGFAVMDEKTFVQKFQEIAQMLVSIIKSWDLLEDDESATIPLTIERILAISPVISMQIIQAIAGDLRPETIAPQMKRG
jgi:hypothetical protein